MTLDRPMLMGILYTDYPPNGVWQVKTEVGRKLVRLAWLIWGTATAAQFLNLFHRIAGATIADRLMADFNLTATAVGTLMALLFYVYGFMQFPSGVLADSLGPRKMLSFGCLIASLGAVIFGLAPSLPVLFIGRFLVALGISVFFVNVFKVTAEWFRSRDFGLIAALVPVISHGGALVATTPLALLVTWTGWRASFELVGLLSLASALACWLIIRNRPHDLGLPSPSELEGPESSHPAQSSTKPSLSFGQRVRMVFTNPYTWPPFIVGACLYGTFLTFAGAWGVPYLMQVYNMTRSTAANFMLLASIGIMAGSPIIAYISNRVLQRRKLPAIVCTSAYLSLWLTLTFWNAGTQSPQALGTIFFLLGFFVGHQSQNLANLKEVSPPIVFGMAIGVLNMGPFLTPAILQPLFGRILDLGWQGAIVEGARVYPMEAFHSALLLICAAAAISALGAFLVKETKCRNLVA